MTGIYDFEATTIDGGTQSLAAYEGKALLIANVASKCGFTPQYEGLERLYDTYADRGLVVLGFPCDQFGHQEPGDEEQIAEFCSLTYGVTFPMFAKVDVNGRKAHPLYRWLTAQKRGLLGGCIAWNFTKFLVSPGGQVVGRYAPTKSPESLVADIEAVLPT
ncbi:MAG TPA: glutathione peroxidase [Microthrixaceae bacterium]|nr:glutathione peroxidase [Microthrixaceae bacterium]HNI36117.1 glutathione peroxidase [Microthrixaceae bacterium]